MSYQVLGYISVGVILFVLIAHVVLRRKIETVDKVLILLVSLFLAYICFNISSWQAGITFIGVAVIAGLSIWLPRIRVSGSIQVPVIPKRKHDEEDL
ncbi:MAG: hypothetical protein ABSC49_00075 [Candidatus Microgenomates bacterium]|jgi:hypothetical protein